MKEKLWNLFQSQNIGLEKDVFNYGYDILMQYVSIGVVLLFVGVIFHCIDSLILVILLYLPFRKYIGGFHFENKTLCCLFSILFATYVSVLSQSVVLPFWIGFVLVFMLSFWNETFGCIDHPNKRISSSEKEFFREKMRKVLFLYFYLLIGVEQLSWNIVKNAMVLVMLFSLFNVSIGRWRMKRYDNNNLR